MNLSLRLIFDRNRMGQTETVPGVSDRHFRERKPNFEFFYLPTPRSTHTRLQFFTIRTFLLTIITYNIYKLIRIRETDGRGAPETHTTSRPSTFYTFRLHSYKQKRLRGADEHV